MKITIIQIQLSIVNNYTNFDVLQNVAWKIIMPYNGHLNFCRIKYQGERNMCPQKKIKSTQSDYVI